jgi:hypothetical protein
MESARVVPRERGFTSAIVVQLRCVAALAFAETSEQCLKGSPLYHASTPQPSCHVSPAIKGFDMGWYLLGSKPAQPHSMSVD